MMKSTDVLHKATTMGATVTRSEWYAFVAIGGIAFIGGLGLAAHFLYQTWPSIDWTGILLTAGMPLGYPYMRVVQRHLGLAVISFPRYFLGGAWIPLALAVAENAGLIGRWLGLGE